MPTIVDHIDHLTPMERVALGELLSFYGLLAESEQQKSDSRLMGLMAMLLERCAIIVRRGAPLHLVDQNMLTAFIQMWNPSEPAAFSRIEN